MTILSEQYWPNLKIYIYHVKHCSHVILYFIHFLRFLSLCTAGLSRVGKQGGKVEPATGRGGRNRKSKTKRIKQNESSDSSISHRRQLFRQELQGLNQTSWSPSDTSQSAFPVGYPSVVPSYPHQVYPGTSSVPPRVDAPLSGFGDSQCTQNPRFPMQPMQPQFPAPLVTPMVALVLPNYMFPQLGSAPRQPFYPEQVTLSCLTFFFI